MKADRQYPKITVTPKGERSITGGHPWVYDNDIIESDPCENGTIVDVVNKKGSYLGSGYISEKSKIRVRLISRNANDRFDADFYRRRLKYAWDYRKTVMGKDVSCCRIIFGEADMFPGLTVDRYNDLLVTQVLSVGTEKIKNVLFPMLVTLLREDGQNIKGLYERNDVAIRRLEGMDEYKGWFDLGEIGLPVPDSCLTGITENGVKYTVDVENGQKTGFFLDQKYNRLAVAKIAAGKTVLDCFTHTGSFALNTAIGGAKKVTAVDVSESAVEMARRNAEINGVSDRMECMAADVFDLLPKLTAPGAQKYDLIILDPPAFTKNRKTTDNAMRGYKEINYRAMKLLPRGGYLATCSCSHFAQDDKFREMLRSAAYDADVQL